MSSAVRLPFSGIAKRMLPVLVTSDGSVSKFSTSDMLFKSLSSHSKQYTKMNCKHNGLPYSSMPSTNTATKTLRMAKLPYLQVSPIRTLSFSVATALLSVDSTKFKKMDTPSIMYFSTIDKIQSRSMNFQFSKSFSSSEKPPSTQSSSLADEIMKSKMKDASPEKATDADETGESSDKGPKPMSKWQKRGYMAFVIFISGALVVNGVLFCK